VVGPGGPAQKIDLVQSEKDQTVACLPDTSRSTPKTSGAFTPLLAIACCLLATSGSNASGQETGKPPANSSYTVANQWGDEFEPWHFAGTWVLGSRENQRIVSIKIRSTDGGQTLSGTIAYHGEGPIDFKASLTGSNSYAITNQWGGESAPWHEAGTWIVGGRQAQSVVSLDICSKDGGETLSGWMTYAREGPIRFKATRNGGQLASGPPKPLEQGPRVSTLTLPPDQIISPNAFSATLGRAILQEGEDQMRFMNEVVTLDARQNAEIRMIWGKYSQRARTLLGMGQWNMLTYPDWIRGRNDEINALLTAEQQEKLRAVGLLTIVSSTEHRPGDPRSSQVPVHVHVQVTPGVPPVNPAAMAARNAFERAARAKAMQSDWKGSAHEYAQMFQAVPLENGEPGFESAAVLLLSGDRAGYQARCAELLEKAGTLGVRGYHAARACTLSQDSTRDFALAAAKAGGELSGVHGAHWAFTERAALACRQGRFDEAAELLKESLKIERRPGEAVVTWLWLAMAESHRPGREAEAQAWYTIATTWMDQVSPNSTTMPSKVDGLHLHNWLEALVLRKELEPRVRK